MNKLNDRIDELLQEVTWLQAKVSVATPLFAQRMIARLEAITLELRALSHELDTATYWYDPSVVPTVYPVHS